MARLGPGFNCAAQTAAFPPQASISRWCKMDPTRMVITGDGRDKSRGQAKRKRERWWYHVITGGRSVRPSDLCGWRLPPLLFSLSPCHGSRPISSRRRPHRSRRCRCHHRPLDEYVYPFSFSLLTLPVLVPHSPSKSVFAKCKESLQDGPRLEYISWRLWYRELEAGRTNKPIPVVPASCPLTPVSEQGVEYPGKFPFPRLLSFLT